MALETAATIDQLVPTNPVHTDTVAQGDSHLRVIKTAIQGTFPNVSGAITPTAADLSAITGGGTSVTSGGGGPVIAIAPAQNSGVSGSTSNHSGGLTVSGGLVISGGAALFGDVALGAGLSISGIAGLIVDHGAAISGGLNASSGGFTGNVGVGGALFVDGSGRVTGPMVLSGGLSVPGGASYAGGTGQLVPTGGTILMPIASGIPSGYADATAFVGAAPNPAYRYIYKT